MFSWPLVLYLVSRKRANPKGFYPYILQIQLSNLLNRQAPAGSRRLDRSQPMDVGIQEESVALVVHVLFIGRDAEIGLGGHHHLGCPAETAWQHLLYAYGARKTRRFRAQMLGKRIIFPRTLGAIATRSTAWR